MAYFNKPPAGRIVTRATNDVSQIGEIFSDGVVKVFIQFIVLISIVVSMMLISVKQTLICLITTPLFFFLGIKVTNRIRETLRTSKIATSALNSFIAESLSGMKIIQMYQQFRDSPAAICRGGRQNGGCQSTLVNLLLNLYSPPKDKVFIQRHCSGKFNSGLGRNSGGTGRTCRQRNWFDVLFGQDESKFILYIRRVGG